MVDTPTIEYEHSAAATHISMFTKDLKVTHLYEGKNVVLKDGRVGWARDLNRVIRVFDFSCRLSAANFLLIEGYLRPATIPDYSGIYPRFTKVYYDLTNSWANVEVMCTAFSARYTGAPDWEWTCTFTFKEKTDGCS